MSIVQVYSYICGELLKVSVANMYSISEDKKGKKERERDLPYSGTNKSYMHDEIDKNIGRNSNLTFSLSFLQTYQNAVGWRKLIRVFKAA